jgi:crotonobetainyl-CoA:carnitine CoA-transferase CaiB-like acyl-CoA transferase
MMPLSDVRILAIEQYGAGPFGSLQLADLGADVIRIETAGGDVARGVPPFAEGGDSLFYESLNRNKRGIVLDLLSPAGRRVFEDLVARSDVVYSNLRGDVVETLKLRYEDLSHVNPAIVCCSLSGFGLTGPRRAEPAFDYMLQGLCGWMDLTGDPAGPPTKSGLSLVDFAAGIAASASILAGLHAARRDGVGCDCDVSLFDTAMSMLNYVATWQATRGHATARQANSSHPTLTPFQMFRTSDGWIVAGGSKEKFWLSMARALKREDLLEDPRFADFTLRLEHREALIAELEVEFAKSGTNQWIDVLSANGVPCAPVNTVAEALKDPQTTVRGSVVVTEHPRFGVVHSMASAVRAGNPRTEHRRAPYMGEDTRAVLEEVCGYDSAQIDELIRTGAASDRETEPQS